MTKEINNNDVANFLKIVSKLVDTNNLAIKSLHDATILEESIDSLRDSEVFKDDLLTEEIKLYAEELAERCLKRIEIIEEISEIIKHVYDKYMKGSKKAVIDNNYSSRQIGKKGDTVFRNVKYMENIIKEFALKIKKEVKN